MLVGDARATIDELEALLDGWQVAADYRAMATNFQRAWDAEVGKHYSGRNEPLVGQIELIGAVKEHADPEGIIVPKLLVVAADGTQSWEPASDVGLYADLPNLQYDFETLASGTPLLAQLTVTDFGGNSDSVTAEVLVP